MSAPLFKAQEKNRIAGRRLQEAAVKAHPQNLPDIDCRDIRRAVARAMHLQRLDSSPAGSGQQAHTCKPAFQRRGNNVAGTGHGEDAGVMSRPADRPSKSRVYARKIRRRATPATHGATRARSAPDTQFATNSRRFTHSVAAREPTAPSHHFDASTPRFMPQFGAACAETVPVLSHPSLTSGSAKVGMDVA